MRRCIKHSQAITPGRLAIAWHTLTDHNKFVRAWSYNGFFELSRQHSEYLDETKQFFQMTMRDEAPSVKARIRNIMKTGF